MAADNPNFEPFNGHVGIPLQGLFGQETLLTVPADKRLVIDYLNGRIELPTGQTVIHVRLEISTAMAASNIASELNSRGPSTTPPNSTTSSRSIT